MATSLNNNQQSRRPILQSLIRLQKIAMILEETRPGSIGASECT